MFSLVQSQNTLEQVRVTITLPLGNIIYTGNTADTTIDVNKSNATYGIKVNGGAISKKSKGNASMNTSSDLQLGVNTGSTISYIIVPLADENYNYVLDGKSYLTGTFTIVPATLNLTASVTSFTYNGLSRSLSYSVTGAGVDTNYSVSETSYTNAGSYTGTLTTTSSNYVLGTSSVNWSIGKAVLTITSNNLSMTYGSSVPTQSFGYILSGLLGADNENVVTGLNGISVGSAAHSTTATSSSNVGTYPITTNVSGLVATNYTFTAVNGTLTINQAQLNATGITGSATYSGSSQSVAVISGINGTFSGSTSASGTNAGSYTTTITGTGNYAGSVIGTLTINQAQLNATGITGSATYSGSSQSVAVISGINGTFSGSTSASGTNAGSYTTTITGTGNYAGSVIGTLTINQAQLSATGITGSTTYSGSSQSVAVISVINGTFSGSTSASGTNAGSYTTTITGTGNYTGSVIGTLTINQAQLSATGITGSATYSGSSQSVAVISGINGTFTGSTSASGTNTGSYTTTITGTGNYTGSVIGILTINQAQLSATTTTSPYKIYNRASRSFTIGGINGTYSGNPSVSGTNVGSYSTSITGTGNYIGSVIGTLNIYQDSGYVDIFYGGVHDASRTDNIFVPVRTSNAAFTVTHSVSGPGAADAQHTSFGHSGPYDWNQSYSPTPPGAVVRNTNPYTQGFVVTITASINDTNYTFMSATTSVTVNAYVAPTPVIIAGDP